MPPEPFNAAESRLIDANLNRATEALRVCEDLARFHWDLGGVARTLKDLRHALFRVLAGTLEERVCLLQNRDIAGDVGRENHSPEHSAAGPEAILLRNLQRTKEALRTLAEVCRERRPQAHAELERLRYGLYGLEKGLAGTLLASPDAIREQLRDARLYLIASTDGCIEKTPAELERQVNAALEAGCRFVQLREKRLCDRDLLRLGRRLRELCIERGALLIVNDRADIARAVRADGVHLGQDDLPPAAARQILGERAVIGVSSHTAEQAQHAQNEGADYIGIGPVFATMTKADHEPTLGPGGLAAILDGISIPAFAIGGIGGGNVDAVTAAGCRQVAVCSWLLGDPAPGERTRSLLARLS